MRRTVQQWCSLAAIALGVVAALAGCAHKVQVEVLAVPAVALRWESPKIAVVVQDRDCRDVADALVEELNAVEGLEVDPRADVRLRILRCGRSHSADIDIRVEGEQDRRRVLMEGRAHALLAVYVDGEPQAHLIGSARHFDDSAWGDINMLGRRRSMDRALTQILAQDLATQVSPMPRIAERRVHPRAPEGTARRFYHDAVLAELSGDLFEAHRLAMKAWQERPTARTAAYLSELEARLYQTGSRPLPDSR
ncbi:MAG: hypothetical protein JRI25_14170 [Deltaproteobacteria bacterium]|nr:hypothetical protein [Deltaproteobacteria bacterium]